MAIAPTEAPHPSRPDEAAEETHVPAPAIERVGWWRGAGGGKELLAVAGPLVVSSLSWTVMTFVDRMMLNHWSGAAMSAAFVAGVVWWVFLCLPLGVCTYASTFVAQYVGSGRPERVGPSVWQGCWIAAAVTPALLAVAPLSWAAFRAAGHSPEAVELEGRYLAILCLGSPAMLLSGALSNFWSGRGKTVLVMVVDALFAAVNLLLDWWWIFGLTVSVAGREVELFPAGGVAGAAWATVASLWLRTFVYAALMLRRPHRAAFNTHAWRPDRPLLRRMLYFGGPSGVQMLLDVMGFTAFVLLVARLGPVENEATSMTFSISHLAFMPVVGLGMAVSILVGQHLGEDRDRAAARTTWTGAAFAWGYMALISAAFVFAPQWFLAGFFRGEAMHGDPAQRAAVAATAAVLLRFVAAYNVLDATMIVFVSTLKGAGDTRFILLASLVMATLLATLTWVAVEHAGVGLYGCWLIISGWIAGLGAAFLLRFLQGKWRTMRVVEPAPL